MTTTIQVTDEQWNKLNSIKLRNESFADVLDKLLKINQRNLLKSIKEEVTRK